MSLLHHGHSPTVLVGHAHFYLSWKYFVLFPVMKTILSIERVKPYVNTQARIKLNHGLFCMISLWTDFSEEGGVQRYGLYVC